MDRRLLDGARRAAPREAPIRVGAARASRPSGCVNLPCRRSAPGAASSSSAAPSPVDRGRRDVDAEALRRRLEERRGRVTAELARKVRVVPRGRAAAPPTRSTRMGSVPPTANSRALGQSCEKPSPPMAGAPSASTTSGASTSSTSAMRSANVSSDVDVRRAVHLALEQRLQLELRACATSGGRRASRRLVHRPLHPLDDIEKTRVAVRLDLGQRDEHPVRERVGQQLRDEQRGHVRLVHPRDAPAACPAGRPPRRRRRRRPCATSGTCSSARHLRVAGHPHQLLPVGVPGAPALGDCHVVVPARVQAPDDAAHELRVRRAAQQSRRHRRSWPDP